MSQMSTGYGDHEFGEGGALRPLTPKEVSKILGVNPKSVYAAIERGEIPVVRLGRLLLVPRPAFQRLLRGDAA
jgi:excisionase family DNA binding protein